MWKKLGENFLRFPPGWLTVVTGIFPKEREERLTPKAPFFPILVPKPISFIDKPVPLYSWQLETANSPLTIRLKPAMLSRIASTPMIEEVLRVCKPALLAHGLMSNSCASLTLSVWITRMNAYGCHPQSGYCYEFVKVFDIYFCLIL